MEDTGRVWFIVEGDVDLLTVEPTGLDYETWTEAKDEDGDLWYLSDTGTVLSADEFFGE
jgi:hypothetical protein